MRVKAQKPFPYSPDGITTHEVKEGEEFDCRPDIFDGLVQEGFVSPVTPKKGAGGKTNADGLKTDGPTLVEYVAAGYPADKYPPLGYSAKQASPADKARVAAVMKARAEAEAAKGQADAAFAAIEKAAEPEKAAAEAAYTELDQRAKQLSQVANDLTDGLKG